MKNIKQLVRQVAQDNGWSEREVMDVATFTMQQLKENLTGLHHKAVTIPHVGTFVTKIDKLRKNIHFTIRKIRFYRDSPRCKVRGVKRQYILDAYWVMLRRQLKVRNELVLHHLKLKAYYAGKRIRKAAQRLAKQNANAANSIPPEEAAPGNTGVDNALQSTPASRTLSLDSTAPGNMRSLSDQQQKQSRQP